MSDMKTAAPIPDRKEWLKNLDDICTSRPSNNEPSLVLGVAEYVLLHYSLVTQRPANVKDAGEAIRKLARHLRGFTIDGSVWVLPQPSDEEIAASGIKEKLASVGWAAFVWNSVADVTGGLLTEGDTVYVHYSGHLLDKIGVAGQVVPAGASGLANVVLR